MTEVVTMVVRVQNRFHTGGFLPDFFRRKVFSVSPRQIAAKVNHYTVVPGLYLGDAAADMVYAFMNCNLHFNNSFSKSLTDIAE